MNKAILIGRLGRDPEVKFLESGTVVGNFSLATDGFRGKGDKREKFTEWHNITVFGATAENCGKYLTKGSQAGIDGEIQTEKWEDKEGNKRQTTKIIANRVEFIGSRGDSNDRRPTLHDDEMPF